MYDERKYRMSAFHRGLYRHHVNSARNFDKKHGQVSTVTTVSISKDDPSERTEHVAVLDRTWPLDVKGIKRILQLHTLMNRGEGRTQALRLIVELDDRGERGVMAATIDQLQGSVDFRFSYKSWAGTQVGGTVYRISDLLRPDGQTVVLRCIASANCWTRMMLSACTATTARSSPRRWRIRRASASRSSAEASGAN